MQKTFELLPPTMPNFIFYKMPAGAKSDGFKSDKNQISVADLTPEEAEEYGELMKRTFILHAAAKRTSNAQG